MIEVFNIPEEPVKECGLTYAEFFYLLFRTNYEKDYEDIEKVLIKKGLVKPTKKFPDRISLCLGTDKLVNNVKYKVKQYLEMEQKKVAINPDFIPLAGELQELYPKGVRPGCSQQWRGSKLIIAKKLTTLTRIYGITFTKEEAIDAVKRYVESFKGDYHYMECLEYFILRLRPEFKSNFTSYLDNKDAGEEDMDDFNIKLR